MYLPPISFPPTAFVNATTCAKIKQKHIIINNLTGHQQTIKIHRSRVREECSVSLVQVDIHSIRTWPCEIQHKPMISFRKTSLANVYRGSNINSYLFFFQKLPSSFVAAQNPRLWPAGLVCQIRPKSPLRNQGGQIQNMFGFPVL